MARTPLVAQISAQAHRNLVLERIINKHSKGKLAILSFLHARFHVQRLNVWQSILAGAAMVMVLLAASWGISLGLATIVRSWPASSPQLTAQVGVAGVTLDWKLPAGQNPHHVAIYRNHQYLAYANVPGYLDADIVSGASYAYTIVPIDGKHKPGRASNIARITAPSMPSTSTIAPAPTGAATPSPGNGPVSGIKAKAASSGGVPGQAAVVAAAGNQFVTRRGSVLYLGNQPYRFTGFNIYNANSRNNCAATMGEGPALDEALNAIGPGKTVMRSWFFQNLATTGGARDWRAFDHTLAVARAHGVRVIATLGNQWGECEQGHFKPAGWYEDGYRTDATGGIVGYRDWVQEAVTRYRDDPTIMAWQLMNEAETSVAQNGGCVPNSAATLRAFADDMGGLVHALDHNHLVSLGTIGSGQCGAAGDDYKQVHASPGIDLCEYHDYGDTASLPGDQWNGLQVRLDQCQALGKPLFIGEVGARPSEVGGTYGARVNLFARKIGASFDAGAVGELVWSWMERSTIDDYDVGPGDPIINILGQF